MENRIISDSKLILDSLADKAVLKQDVFQNTLDAFNKLKVVLKTLTDELRPKVKKIDERLVIDFIKRSDFQAEIRVAGEELVFIMHTNTFTFDKEHSMWRTSYIQQDHTLSYCGMISIYNFLADSFRYNRTNDIGYLIGRLFINKEKHFFVEGKRQLGYLYNDFGHAVLDEDHLKSIVQSAIMYSLDFDLYTPPYDQVKMVSVEEVTSSTTYERLTTGKRLGFRFQGDPEIPEED